jgi:hypothetical protein
VTRSIVSSVTSGNLAAIPLWALIILGVLAVAEIALDVVALVDLFRRPVSQVALGNKWVWVVIIILINLVGAILYLAIGRKPVPLSEPSGPPSTPRGNPESVADALYGSRDDTDSP